MLFGFGLIEAIPDRATEANEGRAGGRAARLPSGRLGRFGRDLTVDFIRFLAPPPSLRRDEDGAEVFHQLGCAECHRPSFVTSSPIKVLNRQALMGLRARSRFLHDGRALTLESAIAAHGGRGAAAATAFSDLSRRDRDALLRFLKSL
jgi:CxxC motif-containing protein (DUF1111 family)